MIRILLVDDEPNVLQALRRSLSRQLRDLDIRLELFEDARAALLRAADLPFDAAISDFHMPSMNGLEFLKRFRELQPTAIRLVLTAATDFQIAIQAINEAEIHRYIVKPWDDTELAEILRTALEKRRHLLENAQLADERRHESGRISASELERRRLEQEYPGLTRVDRAEDGSIIIDPADYDEDLKF